MTEETIHETEEKRSRRGISSFLRRISNRLRRGEPVPADEEQTVTVEPPEEADLNVEIEREDGNISLEVDVEWPEEEGGEIEMEAQASKATFLLYEDDADEHRWRLRHDNGNIIANGSEGYASRQKAKQGLESVKANVAGAYVEDLSKDEQEESQEGGSKATFELFRDKQDKFRWRLVHDNGNIIADCGQGYSSKQKAKQGLNSVKSNAPGAPVETEA
ncbi:HVO_2922 family protein [Halovenus sp. HT40]|uniref:HVO_2922 family protein n=1 Tax=Halovenus sp. HT40 TaxID=3126691 RepID=UPI00300EA288